jgi:radical SAM protein with 4Fe4S-binding SPASM domain
MRREHSTHRINYRHPATSLANYLTVRACYACSTEFVAGYPSKIVFEPTSFCNLKCPLCPTGVGALHRADGYMSLEQFRSIVEEIKPYTTHIEFAGYGEPFMHADICEMVRYASSTGIFTNMHTNANLIDTPEKVHGLITSGLGHLTLSIDGATQDVYEKYRVGGSLERVASNVRALFEERNRLQATSPVVTVQTVVTKKNEHQVEDMRKLAEDLGADNFRAKAAHIVMGRPRKITGGLVDHWVSRDNRFNRFFKRRNKQQLNGCDWLYKRASIHWNGDITTCCYDATSQNKMGNIFEAGSFWTIWNSPKYRALRRQVNEDITKAEPLCSVCPARTMI